MTKFKSSRMSKSGLNKKYPTEEQLVEQDMVNSNFDLHESKNFATFNFNDYDYQVSSNENNFDNLKNNKILQENLKGERVVLSKGYEKQYCIFDKVAYDRKEKKYYIEYHVKEKPSGGLTGEVQGKWYVDEGNKKDIKIARITGSKLK